MNNLNVLMKKFTKDYLKSNSDIVFKNRELIIEEDCDGVSEHSVFRFKIGDGITPYCDLKYISSLYTLFPNIILYDEDYNNSITLKFTEES